MATSMRDLIDGEAELNDEEDDESFDEEAGEPRARDRNKMLDDSSEEDEDDEDEEEARRVWTLCTPASPTRNC
jgi:transcription elongation factor SPT6